jgi:quinol-cytochrome oxidoreductase complex cytochrome b subunit
VLIKELAAMEFVIVPLVILEPLVPHMFIVPMMELVMPLGQKPKPQVKQSMDHVIPIIMEHLPELALNQEQLVFGVKSQELVVPW